MGSNLLIVMSGSTSSGGARGGFGSMPTLTWDDLRAIQAELPSVKYAAAQLRSGAQILSDDSNWSTQITGTAPDFFAIRNWPPSEGALFTQSDVEGGTKVVVLGQTVADKLFGPGIDAVGQTVRIKNIPFVVVGILSKKGQSPMGQDYDDAAFVPQSTFQAKIQGGLQKFIAGVVMVGAAGDTQRAQNQIAGLLRDRHHIGQGGDDDFQIRDLAEIASAQEDSAKMLTLLLTCIALVSLLVGGIGIMNIMLVSVTERTREIGVRMAVGAKPRNILLQFLVESATLSLAGGLIGIAIGVFGASPIAKAMGTTELIRYDVIAVAVGFSALVGMIFGLYPAWKASLLDPIDALRFE
jgi:putative ABC transport system permease protein